MERNQGEAGQSALEPQGSRRWIGDYALIMAATAAIGSGNYFFFSTLPIYAQRLTGSTALAGLMTGVYTLSALCSRPVSGFLVDRLGRVKIAMAGAFLALVSSALYTCAGSFSSLIVLRVLHGFAFGVHSTAALTVAVDIIPEKRRMEWVGYLGLFNVLASAVGPALALSLALNRENGFRTLFILSAGLAAVAITAEAFIAYERNGRRVPRERRNTGRTSGTFLGFEKSSLPVAGVLFIFAFASGSINSYVALFAKVNEYGNVGLFFTLSAVGAFASRFFAGRVGDRHGARVLIVPALLASVACYLLLSVSASNIHIVLLGLPYGLIHGTVVPTMNVLIIDRAPAELRGAANATYYAAMDTGIGLGAICWGAVAQVLGFRVLYRIAAFFPLLALSVFLCIFGLAKTRDESRC